MKTTWLPWSAASLACGSGLTVLGTLMLPADGDFAVLLTSVRDDGGQWLMASFAFFFASVAMTLGLPTLMSVLGLKGRRTGLVGIGVWAVGTIGMAGYAALLILFRTVANTVDLDVADVEAISTDATLVAFILLFVGAFRLGEVVTALALLRSGSLSTWIPALLLVHVALGLAASMLPAVLVAASALVLAVALMGVAVQANDKWTVSVH